MRFTKINPLTLSYTTEPTGAWLVAVSILVVLDVANTTTVGTTGALLIRAIGILKASTPTALIADVCTLLEAPTRV